jgi:hypothetical protein
VDETLEWVEKAALGNLKDHGQVAETLGKEASTTLTVLLAALSGAFGYSIATSAYQIGATALTVYLFLLCAILVTKCMMIGEFPALTNEPRNLMQEGFSLDALRRAELKNMQSRIDEAASRNATTAQWLNRVRLGAVGSPAIFGVATFAVEMVHSCAAAGVAG